eukprot:779325-Amphidinium_carterae.1
MKPSWPTHQPTKGALSRFPRGRAHLRTDSNPLSHFLSLDACGSWKSTASSPCFVFTMSVAAFLEDIGLSICFKFPGHSFLDQSKHTL